MTPRQVIGFLIFLASVVVLVMWAGWKVTLGVYLLIFANNLLTIPEKGIPKKDPPPI